MLLLVRGFHQSANSFFRWVPVEVLFVHPVVDGLEVGGMGTNTCQCNAQGNCCNEFDVMGFHVDILCYIRGFMNQEEPRGSS